VFDVLSTKSSVCLNITVDADADLMCSEGNKQMNQVRNKKKTKEREREREKKAIRMCNEYLRLIGVS
jgi:hypothetical protein